MKNEMIKQATFLALIALSIILISSAVSAAGVNNTTNSTQSEQRNVIFIHPDGTGLSHFTAARLLHHGVNGTLNWDKMPHMAVSRIHVNDSIQAGSVAGAVAHGTGYRTHFEVYGLDKQGRPLRTLMEEADDAGFSIGIINSGTITEPGSGAFVAQVRYRANHTEIARQILEQMPDVILGGGEQWFLPNTTTGRHGAGRRTDGRNLIEEARTLGYTIVFNATELLNIPDNTTRLLGLFAAHNIFNDISESDLRARNLTLYRAGSPTLAQMTEAAIRILSRNRKGFFLVVEEEGTDNFGNINNAEGTIEATRRADDAIGVALKFADTNPNTLVLVASDSEAGGFAVGGSTPTLIPAGVPLPERLPGRPGAPDGGPIDGVNGTGGSPFVTPCGFTFGIVWAGTPDFAGGTPIRAYGLNAEMVKGTIDNIAIHDIMRTTLARLDVTASQVGGNFRHPLTVNLTRQGGLGNVTIFFTTDGSTPTNASAVYTEPLTFNKTTTLRFFAQDNRIPRSPGQDIQTTRSQVFTQTYNIYRPVTFTYSVSVPITHRVRRWVRERGWIRVRGRWRSRMVRVRRWVGVTRHITEYRTGHRWELT